MENTFIEDHQYASTKKTLEKTLENSNTFCYVPTIFPFSVARYESEYINMLRYLPIHHIKA